MRYVAWGQTFCWSLFSTIPYQHICNAKIRSSYFQAISFVCLFRINFISYDNILNLVDDHIITQVFIVQVFYKYSNNICMTFEYKMF